VPFFILILEIDCELHRTRERHVVQHAALSRY
jgi:hypothetical protein